MKKIQKAWIVLSAITMTIFALAIVAYAIISFLLAGVLMPEQYPILNMWMQMFSLDLSFMSSSFLSFLSGYEVLAFFGIIAIILLSMSGIAYSKFNGHRAKYFVALIVGLIFLVGTAVYLILNIADAFKINILVYVATGSVPLLGLIFGIFAFFCKKPVLEAQQDTDQAEQAPQHNPNPIPVEHTHYSPKPIETTAATVEAPQAVEIEQKPIVEEKPVVGQKPVSEPQIYKAREPETISEIVARTYGEPKKVTDDIKRKKLQKIREMYEVGAITLYEYQQLTIRIMGDK